MLCCAQVIQQSILTYSHFCSFVIKLVISLHFNFTPFLPLSVNDQHMRDHKIQIEALSFVFFLSGSFECGAQGLLVVRAQVGGHMSSWVSSVGVDCPGWRVPVWVGGGKET